MRLPPGTLGAEQGKGQPKNFVVLPPHAALRWGPMARLPNLLQKTGFLPFRVRFRKLLRPDGQGTWGAWGGYLGAPPQGGGDRRGAQDI